jgi:hypothetical protein
VTTFGFLHTADVHEATFSRLLAEISPGDSAVHLTDASLLTDARRRDEGDEGDEGDDDLFARIGLRLRTLADRGAVRVLCTCSTIAGPAEVIGRSVGVDVLRVDRPMAEQAVAAGDRIAVVAALASTMAPTRTLLQETADAAGRRLTIVDAPCLAAWSHFEAGALDRYLATLATHLQSLDQTADVIVLAQASMAPVAALVSLSALVLSSPRPAVLALVS